MAVEVPADFRSYVEKLAEVSGVTISNFDDMIAALRKRHDFFANKVAVCLTMVLKNSTQKITLMLKSRLYLIRYMAAQN